MNKIMGILMILIFSVAIAIASDGDAGYAATFMRNGVGARPLGMGGAFTAVAEGPEATYFNPAGLGFGLKFGASLSYKSMSLDRHLGHVVLSFPIRNEAAMAASWVNAGTSDIPSRGYSRQPEGNVGNSQNAFALSFAKAIDSTISVGGSLRYLQEKYASVDAFAIGVDLGFLAKIRHLISIGGVIQNLGSNYRWDSSNYWTEGDAYEEKLPIVMKFGLAGNLLSGALLPAIDFEKSNVMGLRVRAGVEYWFIKKVMKKVEDEYEEGKFVDIERGIRWAGLRIGLDRGSPTFGATYAYPFRNTSLAIEYAYLVGRQGTSASHLFTLKLGL